MQEPNFLIIGAGGVGGYYGARLVQAGYPVHFIARGEHLKHLQNQALVIQSIHDDFSVGPVSASIEIPDQEFDYVFVCVKSYDTQKIIDLLKPIQKNIKTILSLQNGVENEELFIAALGEEKVLGGLCYIGSELDRPGHIIHVAKGGITFGEWGQVEKQSLRCLALKSAFDAAKITSNISENIELDLWKKLLWNVGFNPLCTLLRTQVSPLLTRPDLRALVIQAMQETVQIAELKELALTQKHIDLNMEVSDRELHDVRPSMLQDYEKGKRLEYETFCGYLVRQAEKFSVALPVNKFLNASMRYLDDAGPS